MRKLLIFAVLIASIAGAAYLALPYLPEGLSLYIDKALGRDPGKIIISFYENIDSEKYQQANNLFAEKSQSFYNKEYLKNMYTGSGRPKISRLDIKGKAAVIFYKTESNRSQMTNLIKENGKWVITEINDDPGVTID